jgi:tetratricopeptide (TPR) repeat protein
MNGILVSLLLLMVSLCPAENVSLVRGRVQSDAAHLGNDMIAELENLDRRGPANHAQVGGDGSFEFRDVATGRHALRITTLYGDIICEQMVDVLNYGTELSIRLPKRSSERSGSGTISVRELQRPVPQKAMHAFAEGMREAQTGHSADAIRKLELAVRLYPDFADARTNLGVQYTRLGRFQEALEQFEKAVACGEPSAILYGNLSYAYSVAGRLRDAEYAARRSLSLDAHYLRGHYLLGSVLARSIRPGALEKAPEAARHLRLGAADVPRAHIDIAQIYLVEGDPLSAAAELRLYLNLNTGETSDREKVERWLRTSKL